MAQVFSQYFLYMRRVHVFLLPSHIPGHLNELADALSRLETVPDPLGPKDFVAINVVELMGQDGIHVTNQRTRWPETFRIGATKKDGCRISRCIWASFRLVGILSYFGWLNS